MFSCVRLVVSLGVVVLALASNPTLAKDSKSPLNQLDNSDLLDLLDADLDEAFLTKGVRGLQEINTMSPTPAPSMTDREIDDTAAPTEMGVTAAPTVTPTKVDDGLDVPTDPPSDEPDTDEASGAMVWRPASAAMAVAAVVLAATAVIA